ncbi:hypothetical protein C0J52_13448 [Blattella germanica]|nr:hypothetical protein C0J52_13448 [Blattella germanica]
MSKHSTFWQANYGNHALSASTFYEVHEAVDYYKKTESSVFSSIILTIFVRIISKARLLRNKIWVSFHWGNIIVGSKKTDVFYGLLHLLGNQPTYSENLLKVPRQQMPLFFCHTTFCA